MKQATATVWVGEGRRTPRPRRLTPYGNGRDPLASERRPAVLVADPDPDTRRHLGGLLAGDELSIVEAGDEEAVKLAAADGAVDLAVVDADLPGASRLRRHLGHDLPIILVARELGPFADAVAMALDAVGVLVSPVDEDDLRTIVWNLAIPR
jgi:CheY-like chemotaxis protein